MIAQRAAADHRADVRTGIGAAMLIPPQISYPGVYIVEATPTPGGIPDLPTSITAFVGRALMGPTDEPLLVQSLGDFETLYGGLSPLCPLSRSVRQFFDNGGAQALIARLYVSWDEAEAVQAALGHGQPALYHPVDATHDFGATGETYRPQPDGIARLASGAIKLRAANPGRWGDKLSVTFNTDGINASTEQALGVAKGTLFNLVVTCAPDANKPRTERFSNITLDPTAGASRVDRFLEDNSLFLRWDAFDATSGDPILPSAADLTAVVNATKTTPLTGIGGSDGGFLDHPAFFVGPGDE
ncbi:MAG: hypothetical protein KC620_23565, partial [Myxococcales bacterium]|nr:hypothetical protein [Myxococcales bacterium]